MGPDQRGTPVGEEVDPTRHLPCPRGQVGPERDHLLAAEVVGTVHFDAKPLPDRAARAIGGDHIPRPHAAAGAGRTIEQNGVGSLNGRTGHILADWRSSQRGPPLRAWVDPQLQPSQVRFETADAQDLHRSHMHARARGSGDAVACLSTSSVWIPWRDSSSEAVRPAGPPPTISTGTSSAPVFIVSLFSP